MEIIIFIWNSLKYAFSLIPFKALKPNLRIYYAVAEKKGENKRI